MLVVFHVGDVVRPDLPDSPLKDEMHDKMARLITAVLDPRKKGAPLAPPGYLIVSPFLAGRQSQDACRSILTPHGTQIGQDVNLGRCVPLDQASLLNSDTNMYGPLIGESDEEFRQRVTTCYHKYYNTVVGRKINIWLMTHSDVMTIMAELAGKVIQRQLDYHTYFTAFGGTKVADYHHTQAPPPALPIFSELHDQPAPKPKPASSTPVSKPKPKQPQVEERDFGQQSRPYSTRSWKRAKVTKKQSRLEVTQVQPDKGEEFDASIKPPNQSSLLLLRKEDDYRPKWGAGIVQTSASAGINLAKIMGLPYTKTYSDPVEPESDSGSDFDSGF